MKNPETIIMQILIMMIDTYLKIDFLNFPHSTDRCENSPLVSNYAKRSSNIQQRNTFLTVGEKAKSWKTGTACFYWCGLPDLNVNSGVLTFVLVIDGNSCGEKAQLGFQMDYDVTMNGFPSA